MAETDVTGAAKKSKGAAKQKKSKSAPSHPKVSEMVNSAISSLKERGGSSVHAIKKYTASHYKVDIEKLSPFIKKYLRSAVASGALVQTKGKGASGSFRMSASSSPTKEKTVSKAKKSPKEVVATKKPKVTPKKAVKPKKAAEKKKPKKAPAATKKAKPAKSPKKPVKAAKSKAAAAKPKKAKASPKKSAASKRGKK